MNMHTKSNDKMLQVMNSWEIDSFFLLSHQRCTGQSYRNWYLFSDLLFPKVRENRWLKSWWKGRKQIAKLVLFFKNDTVASGNTGFLLNTKADCQCVSPSPRADGSLLQTDLFSDSHHQPTPQRSMQSPSEVSRYYFRHCIMPVLSSSRQGSKGRKAQVSQARKRDLLPQNPHFSFPI